MAKATVLKLTFLSLSVLAAQLACNVGLSSLTSICDMGSQREVSAKKLPLVPPQDRPENVLAKSGRNLMRLGRENEAIGKFKASLAIAPSNSLVRNDLAVCLEKEGRYEDAFVQRKEVFIAKSSTMAFEPEQFAKLLDLSEKVGRSAEVEPLLENGVKRAKGRNQTYGRWLPPIRWGDSRSQKISGIYLAAAIQALGPTEFELALKRSQQALELNPGNAEAAVYAAYAALYADKPDAAITGFLNRIGQQAPSDVRKAAAVIRSKYPPYPSEDKPWPSGA